MLVGAGDGATARGGRGLAKEAATPNIALRRSFPPRTEARATPRHATLVLVLLVLVQLLVLMLLLVLLLLLVLVLLVGVVLVLVLASVLALV